MTTCDGRRPWLKKQEVLDMLVNPNDMTGDELRVYVRQHVDKLIMDHCVLLDALHAGNTALVEYATEATKE